MTDVVSLDSSEMLVVARHRETCQLTLWRLSLQENYTMSQGVDDESNVSMGWWGWCILVGKETSS